jgi:putative transcriptional regulator
MAAMTEKSEKPKSGASGYLQGQLLLAMPTMGDPRFERTVIYMCAHSGSGAMGIVVNKLLDSISFTDLLEQLNITTSGEPAQIRIHYGGPVETNRGFVLHTTDFIREGTAKIGDDFALTGTLDVLRAIALGQGPKRALLALGCAGWAPGQLDAEIQNNGWLHAPADPDLVFGAKGEMWGKAVARLGIDIAALSGTAGHA